jgi:hypothetical protein
LNFMSSASSRGSGIWRLTIVVLSSYGVLGAAATPRSGAVSA